MTLEPQQSIDVRRDISRSVVALLKEYVGRGPTNARTIMGGDLVVVLLADTLTKGERVLAGQDQVELVREMRRSILRSMSEQLTIVVEEGTGRRVRAVLGDHSVEPDYAFAACVLESEAEAEAQTQAPAQAAEREQQRQISRGMVGLYKEFIGRGPTEARSYIEGDLVASLLGDTLTKAERTLADEERPESVRDMRRQFQEALQERACKIVADATGREVVAFMSDHEIESDYALEVFLLAD